MMIKTDDFFPYSDCPHCFWVGYFTSRTAKKRFERVASGFLQAARQLEFMSLGTQNNNNKNKNNKNKKNDPSCSSNDPSSLQAAAPLFALEDALGINQHHDGITGTEKQHVANDYSYRLQMGFNQAISYVETWVEEQLILPLSSSRMNVIVNKNNQKWQQEQEENLKTETSPSLSSSSSSSSSWLEYCGHLNESICEASTNTNFSNPNQIMYVVIYNPLAQKRNWLIRLPISINGTFGIERVIDNDDETDNETENEDDGNNGSGLDNKNDTSHSRRPPRQQQQPQQEQEKRENTLYESRQIVTARNIPLYRRLLSKAAASGVDKCTIPNGSSTSTSSDLYEIEFYASSLIPLGAVTYSVTLQQEKEEQQQQEEKEEYVEEEEHSQDTIRTIHKTKQQQQQLLRHTQSRTMDKKQTNNNEKNKNHKWISLDEEKTQSIQAKNGHGLYVWFDATTGQLQRVSTDYGITSIDLQIQWGYYLPYDHEIDQSDDGRENSGAYIFRPSTPNATLIPVVPIPIDDSTTATTTTRTENHPLVDFVMTERGLEVHTAYGTYNDDTSQTTVNDEEDKEEEDKAWIHQIVRVSDDQPWIEIEYTIGPIPLDVVMVNDTTIMKNGETTTQQALWRGKEVVLRLISNDIQNNGTFYTDSNARQFMKRERNQRPTWNLDIYEPIAGNYYPITAAIYIQDEDEDDENHDTNSTTNTTTNTTTTTTSLTLITDRSLAGGSIIDGSLEVLIQRRLVVDDHRGVDEPLNETCGGQITPYPPYGNATRIGQGAIVSGIQRIMIGNNMNNNNNNNGGGSDTAGTSSGAKAARSVMDQVFSQPLIFVGSATTISNSSTRTETTSTVAATATTASDPMLNSQQQHQQQNQRRMGGSQQQQQQRSSFAVLGGTELPPNVYFMTLMTRRQRWRNTNNSTSSTRHHHHHHVPTKTDNNKDDGCWIKNGNNNNRTLLLIRLGHQYDHDEDIVLSTPVQINLAVLFQPKYKVISIVEKTLSGNQNWTEFVTRNKYNWTTTTTRTTTRTDVETTMTPGLLSAILPNNKKTMNRMSTTTTATTTTPHTTIRNKEKSGDWTEEGTINTDMQDYETNAVRRKNKVVDDNNNKDDMNTVITLFPMDIRTFEMVVELNNDGS